MNAVEFPLKAESEAVIGAAFEVLNTLGHGLLEKPYERALCVELSLRGIPFEQQPRFDMQYKAVPIGAYIPDLIVFEQIVVDQKRSTGSPITNSVR